MGSLPSKAKQLMLFTRRGKLLMHFHILAWPSQCTDSGRLVHRHRHRYVDTQTRSYMGKTVQPEQGGDQV